MPILTTLKGWKYGFDSPFKAEVYFINSTLFTDEKWGTKNPITLSDDRFGLIEIRAFGTYAFRIEDAGKFIIDIVGTDNNFTNFEINEHLKSLIATRFTDTVGEANLPIELYAANTTELSETCKEVMQTEFNSVGISLEKFFIENVSMPEDLKKEIFEYSRIDKLDLDKLTKFKTAKAISIAGKYEDKKLLDKAFDDIDQALAEGDIVCIFPEGSLTADGNMRTFRDGVERIIERRPVPVIPMALKGLWGSAFSRHRSIIVYRVYKGFRSCVGLVVGEQVEPEKVSVKMLQDRVQKLYRN
jgi:hypothetical protein